jgi:peptidyl-prolyl cis-trans isomerase SurA
MVVIPLVLCFPDNPHGAMPDRVVAIVNNEAITLTDYKLFMKYIGLQDKGDGVDEGLLRALIEEKIILNEAKRKGIEVSDGEVDAMMEKMGTENALSRDEMEKAFEGEGMGIQDFKKLLKEKLTALKLVEGEVDSRVRVNEKEIEDFYHAHKSDYLGSPGKVEVRAIFLKLNEGATASEITDLKRKALKIMAQLNEGQTFEHLVDQYDVEYLKKNEGRLGEFERGTLIPQLDKTVFSMYVGETSEPLWLKEGVYILKVVNKTNDIYKPVGEVREQIRAYLSEEKREALLHAWIKTLWERTSIKIQ